MAFNQFKLDKSNNQSRGIFDTYIYKTEDTCAEVSAAGYFDASRFAQRDPVSWNNSIIEVQCADGFGKGFINPAGNFVFFLGGAESEFCDWAAFFQLLFGASVAVDELAKTISVTTTGGGFEGAQFMALEEPAPAPPVPLNIQTFEPTIVSFEHTFVTVPSLAGGNTNGLLFLDNPIGGIGSSTILAGIAYAFGDLIDAVTGDIIDAFVLTNGYIMGVTYDNVTETFTGYDSEGNSAILAKWPTFNASAPLYYAWQSGNTEATTSVHSPNLGDRPYVLAGSTGVGYCKIEPYVPTLCNPVTLDVAVGSPPQTLVLSGTNNLTATATSLGNDVIGSGIASQETFTFLAQTDEVKIETQVTEVPVSFTSELPVVSLGFFHDIDQPVPTLITSFVYAPTFNGGTLIDANGDLLGSGFNYINPTYMATYIKNVPQQKVYVFQVDQGVAGSVNVHGVTTNITGSEQQEDIAANIVADWASFGADPTVEDVYLGDPSDSRSVFIRYTLASQDATVSVTPTNVTIFDNFPDDSRAYQLAQARHKFENIFTDADFFDAFVSPNYDPAKPIYMVSGMNAGDDLGTTLVQTVNFGSSAFVLGEDAFRWCNLS